MAQMSESAAAAKGHMFKWSLRCSPHTYKLYILRLIQTHTYLEHTECVGVYSEKDSLVNWLSHWEVNFQTHKYVSTHIVGNLSIVYICYILKETVWLVANYDFTQSSLSLRARREQLSVSLYFLSLKEEKGRAEKQKSTQRENKIENACTI